MFYFSEECTWMSEDWSDCCLLSPFPWSSWKTGLCGSLPSSKLLVLALLAQGLPEYLHKTPSPFPLTKLLVRDWTALTTPALHSQRQRRPWDLCGPAPAPPPGSPADRHHPLDPLWTRDCLLHLPAPPSVSAEPGTAKTWNNKLQIIGLYN